MSTLRNHIKVLFVAVVIFLGSFSVWCIDFPGWQPYNKLTGALITPHIPFARPYYRGSTKVLVIAPTWTQRETVELALRISLEYTPLMVYSYTEFGPYKTSGKNTYLEISPAEFTQVVDERIAGDKNYDLIIIGKVGWKVFPEEVQKRILGMVRSGAGLLYINPSGLPDEIEGILKANDDVISSVVSGVPIRQIPLLKSADISFIRSGKLSMGRIICITYNSDTNSKSTGRLECLTPFESDDPLYYDYYYSVLCRACLWAGKKEPEVVFNGFPYEMLALDRANLGETHLSFEVGGNPGLVSSADVYIRDRNNREEYKTVLTPKGSSFSFQMPFLSSGEKILDIILKDRQARVVNWASSYLTVSSDIKIEKVEMWKQIYRKDEPVQGRIFINRQLPSDVGISVAIYDGFNRKVAECHPAVNDLQSEFSLNVKHPLTYAYTLQTTISDSDGIIASISSPFYINTTDFSDIVGDYSFIIWGSAEDNSRSVKTYLQQFHNSGIDVIYVTSALWDRYEKAREVALRIADANLMSAPYSARLFFVSNQYAHLKAVDGKDGPEIQRCLLSLPADKLKDSDIVKHLMDNVARGYGPIGPVYYSLGDENALSFPYFDVCFCTNCQEGFRDYVREMYKTIDDLNASWNTEYKDWAEVKGITLIDAYRQKRYTEWLDFRMFMDNAFSDFHITCASNIRTVDPDAQVGLEGPIYPTRSGTGFNWYRLLPYMGFFGPYRTPVEVHSALSFMPEERLITAWFGSYRGETNEQYMRFFPWAVLFEGMNASAWWTSGVGDSRGLGGASAYSPDFVPLEDFQQACEEVQEIKSGIGKLLISSKRQFSPIALYYSNACLHASTIRPEETTWERSLYDFHYVLRDAGFDYRYLSPDDILDGKLMGISVLILPYSQAISPAEAEKIKEFLQTGGLLIADFAPGIMDQHGKMLEKSLFADIFGKFSPMEVRIYGKGSAVYLGDYIKGYSEKRKRGEGKGICQGIRRFLKELSGGVVVPFAQVTDDNNEIRQDVEVSLFENGQAKYLTLIRSISAISQTGAVGPEAGSVSGAISKVESPAVNIQLPDSAFVYDVRNGRFLGNTERFTIRLAPSESAVFALLPGRMDRIDLEIDSGEYRPGDEVLFTILLPEEMKDVGTCLRIEVYAPDGKNITYYMQKIITSGGLAQGIIPLSLDEKIGSYKITVTDVATGVSISRIFRII